MAGHKLTLAGSELFPWLEKNGINLPGGKDAVKGDLVACSVRKNFNEPCDLGCVQYRNKNGTKTKLPAGHRDGAACHMFVHTYKKRRVSKNKLKSTCVCNDA